MTENYGLGKVSIDSIQTGTRVFPGVSQAAKDTKTAYMHSIAAFLREENAASRINLQAAVGIEAAISGGTAAAQRRSATHRFFTNSGDSEYDQHYLDYSDVVSDEVE